jgi:putative YhbY family RNA-binding protein
MAALQLSSAERKDKRAEAHHLEPVVMIGNAGSTLAVVREVDAALRAHGLVKVRVAIDDRAAREAVFLALADELGAAPIQHIGKLLVLWRPAPAKAKEPPREERLPGPRTVRLIKFSKSPTHRPTIQKVKVLGNQRITAGGLVKRAKRRATSLKKRSLG